MAQASRRPRKPARASSSKPLPGWAWLLAGLAIGLSVAVYFYWQSRQHAAAPTTAAQPAPAPPPAAPAPKTGAPKPHDKHDQKAADASKPRFDFYTILPEMEVVVPEAQKNMRPQAKPGVYLLQIGSFRSFAEADGLKARLALLGVESKIETVTSNDKEVWHRVRVGPLTDPRELNKIRTRLLNNNINAIMMQVKE